MRARVLTVVLLSNLVLAGSGEVRAGGYHVAARYEVGGDGGWDYLTLDAEEGKLYVTRGDRVTVLDVGNGKAVGEIPGTKGVHGVALAKDLGRGFTSNGKANTATIFDLKTLAIRGEVKTGAKPDAIIFDPVTRRVFVFNGDSSDATAIDAAGGTVAGTVALGGAPEFAVADGKGTVYVNLEDKSEVVAFDARALKVKSRWPLAPCEEPTGLAMDTTKRRLYAGCHNQLMAVMDADSGKVLATLPIGAGVDATAFDAGTGLAFSSNGDGTLTVVREDMPGHFTVVENVTTQLGARTMALDPKTHKIYLVTKFGPPPPPSVEHPHPRGAVLPGTFVVLVLAD